MLYFDSHSFHMSHFSPFLNSEDIILEDLFHKLLYELNPKPVDS